MVKAKGKDFSELLKHSKNYLTGDLLTKGIAFIMMPFFTYVLTPADYGIMSIYSSFVTIIAIVYGLGIRGAISRYYYEGENDFFQFYSSNFWVVLGIGSILTTLGILNLDHLHEFLKIPKGMLLIGLIVAVPLTLYQFYKSFLIASKDSKQFSRLDIFKVVISTVLAVIIIFMLNDEKYYAKAIAQLITIILFLFVTINSLRKNISFSIKRKHLKYSMVFGLPIVLHLLSQNILNSFDQIIINQTVDAHHAGLYSVAYKIGVVQSIFSMAVLKAWTPIFYEKMNENKTSDIAALAKKYSFIVIAVAVLIITFSKEIIYLATEKSYHESVKLIVIVVVSYFFLFLYTLYVNYAFYFKKTRAITVITIIAGVTNIILNYWLIPIFGYEMAAWTTLASYILLFVLHYFNVKLRFPTTQMIDLRTLIIPTSLILLVATFNYWFFSLNISYGLSLVFRLTILTIVGFIILRKIGINFLIKSK